MRRIVEELLKKSKNITFETVHLFAEEVYEVYTNGLITMNDGLFLLDAVEYFLEGSKDIEANRLSWGQGYIKVDDDGKIEKYAGRLGYGYIKHIRSKKSSRYHLIEYHIVTY